MTHPFKQRLADGETLIGTMVTMATPSVAEMAVTIESRLQTTTPSTTRRLSFPYEIDFLCWGARAE